MAVRFQTITGTTGIVAAGATLNIDTTGLPSLLNIDKIKVTQDVAGGNFDYSVYKSDTFAAAKLLAYWPAVTPSLYDPMDDSSGSPAEALEGAPIPYEDDDATGEIHHQIINHDGIGHVYSWSIEYEEVPIMSAAGAPTFRGYTAGSVLYAGASGLLSQDNANFFWDATNHRLGIGTASPSVLTHWLSTGTGTVRLESASANGGVFQFYGTSGAQKNWVVGANYNVSNAIEITPSTANGGSTFSSPALVATSTQTVGINGTPTTGQLDVFGSGSISARFRITGATGGYVDYYDSTNSAIRGTIGYGAANITGASISDFGLWSVAALKFATGGSATNALTIDTSQRVGIGAAAVAAKLEVTGLADLYATTLIGNSGTGHSFGLNVTAGTNSTDTAILVRDQVGPNSLFRVAGNGQTLHADGTAGAPSVSSITYPTTGFRFTSGPNIKAVLGGSDYLTFDAANFYPAADNSVILGGTGNRWSSAYIGTSLNVGIATNAAGTIYAQGNALSRVNNETNVTGATSPSTFQGLFSRGSAASRSNVVSGDQVASFLGAAFSGATGYWATGEMRVVVDAAVVDNQRPASRIEFYTNAVNAAQTLQYRIDNAGINWFTSSIYSGITTNATGDNYIGSNGAINCYLDTAIGSTGSSVIKFRKARGTQAALADVSNAGLQDNFGTIQFYGYSAGWFNNAAIIAKSDAAVVSGQNPAAALLFYTSVVNGSITNTFTIGGDGRLNSAVAQTTYTGSIAGTAVWSMPFQGASYKKFIIYYNALHDAGGTITFPTAFVKTPTLYGDAAATAITTASTTTLTIAVAATISGFCVVEGY